MAISAISSAVSFETAKQPVERTTKVAEPVNTVEKVPVTETAQKVPAVNSGESGRNLPGLETSLKSCL